MHTRLIQVATFAAVVVLPATALAGGSSTYKGEALADSQATISLKVSGGGGDKKVTKIISKGLPYDPSGGCSGTGRTPKEILEGSFKVKDNGDIKAVGGTTGSGPLNDGELKVVGTLKGSKITGKMQFTYGKDGCDTDNLEFKATK